MAERCCCVRSIHDAIVRVEIFRTVSICTEFFLDSMKFITIWHGSTTEIENRWKVVSECCKIFDYMEGINY